MKYLQKQNVLVAAGIGLSVLILSKLLRKKTKRILCIEIGGQSFKTCILQIEIQNQKKFQVLKKFTRQTITPIHFINFLQSTYFKEEFDEISIASFGPIHLKKDSNYGMIISAPSDRKRSWAQINILKMVQSIYPKKQVKIETDVNTSALGEYYFGKHNCQNSLAYITIGTGIGVGLVVNGKPVHGYMHPEGGHLKLIKKN